MKNLSLDDFALFTHIAQHQSLSAVARQRNVAPSWVSRALARMEAACNVRLAHRTTHGLSITQEGEVFLEHAQRILQTHGQLEDSLSNRGRTVAGCVVISVSQLMAQHVVIPRLAALRMQHPKLSVDLHVDDRLVSMAREGIDIAVRAGALPPQSLVAKPLGHHGRALYASPGYLKQHGTPRTPDDLAQHTLIGNSTTLTHNEWGFNMNGQMVIRTLPGHLRVNSSAAVVALALSGAGIARINDVVGDSLVAQGQLKPVLQRYVQPGQYAVYAMILAERHRAAKIRATMDFLQTCFAAFAQKPQNPNEQLR